jgi:hypothetical protein
VEGF